MKFDTEAIVAATGGTAHGWAGPGPVLTDTRTLCDGAWFLALTGDRFDGHGFVAAAEAAGAHAGVFSRPPGAGWTRPWVEVADTVQALQDLGAAARDRLACPVVGLTGSSGKTTTRALLACALRQLGEVHQTQGNLNNHLGVPMSLLAAPAAPAVVIVEMGTSSPGEIQVLADIVRPDVRLVINVGPAHLEELGGLEGVAREKGALLRSAQPDDLVVLNADDPWLAGTDVPGRRVTYGRHSAAIVRLLSHRVDLAGWCTDLVVSTPSGSLEITVPAPGAHIAHNATAAIAVVYGLGLDLRRAAEDLGTYEPVGMRQRLETLTRGVVAINDAYNANPSSMMAALDLLAESSGRRIAVLGDMLELGLDAAVWHDRVVRHAARHGLDQLVLVGPRMSKAAAEVTALRFPEGAAVAAALASTLIEGDVLLFKGSRGSRIEQVLEAIRDHLNGSQVQ